MIQSFTISPYMHNILNDISFNIFVNNWSTLINPTNKFKPSIGSMIVVANLIPGLKRKVVSDCSSSIVCNFELDLSIYNDEQIYDLSIWHYFELILALWHLQKELDSLSFLSYIQRHLHYHIGSGSNILPCHSHLDHHLTYP